MADSSPSVRELADELNVDPKAIRAWMRRQNWRHPVEAGSAWSLTAEQVDLVRAHFSRADHAMPPLAAPADNDELAEVTVGQLLVRYANILDELRHRGLVRTNNAPIGDLAEYCAAIVYDGLLAPNSEKSYDLVADDGRKVQVKVRMIRPGTSPSAVFSPIRSFGFDVCIFLLVDGDHGGVLAAREWTAQEVQEFGKHRAHTNGVVVRVGQIKSPAARGSDLTDQFRRAWQELIEQVR
ncbi:DUF6998 domain-containing protein [Microbacterium luteum]|uniref:DUF6998 domain-containing protein n=1 Tax=Microbacterium luteum TaxID=2782167 RepID=UPI001888393D|nr:hypothetical protein [Microbacterium luteum]